MYRILRGTAVTCLAAASLLAIATRHAVAQEGVLVFAPEVDGDSISVFSTNADGSLTPVTTITDLNGVGGSLPRRVAVRPDQAFAYLTLSADNRVAVIDTATLSVVQTVATGDAPFGIAISP
ncbi:MAG TPA: beta-propeller fold lactonase family protein, partial [Pseudomonadales bacterium]